MSTFRAPFLALIAALALSPAPAPAHEGHVHGDAPPPPEVRSAPRATAASQAFELVAVLEGDGLVVWLDRFDTNAPVIDAVVDVETPAGPVGATVDGEVYRLPAPWAAEPGTHEMLFTIADGAAVDFLTATLSIPSPAAPAAPPPPPLSQVGAALARGAAQTLGVDLSGPLARTDPAVIGAGLVGFVLGGLVVALARRRRALAVATAALVVLSAAPMAWGQETAPIQRDVAQRLADGQVFVPKSAQRLLGVRTQAVASAEHRRRIALPGRVIPDPNASGYVQTAVGGRLVPPPGGFPSIGATVARGDVLAYVEPSLATIDLSDIAQAQGALDQEIAITAAQVARFRRLADSGAASRTQAEEAEITLNGLRSRRAALDDVRLAPEPLVAPIAGVIATADAAAGRIAEPQAVVFHIIDPQRLLVEALAFDDAAVGTAATAVADDGTAPLTFVGAGVAEQGRARPLHFRLDPPGLARPGTMLTVLAETAEAVTGLAIPRDSVIRAANGAEMVFVHVAPEVFAPRAVRVAPLDGARVLAVAGLEAGERVVTLGAELLGQLR